MKFGKLESVENVSWSLPPDDRLSQDFLAGLEKQAELEIRFGAPAWSHKEWVGRIYPPEAKPSEYLYYYSRYFSTIELNTSHYRIPTREQARKWCDQVLPDFVFCPKIYQYISHSPSGLRDRDLHRLWFSFLEDLGVNRGPCFLQLPPTFDYSLKADLFRFIENWPTTEFELSLEFRHPSWFASGHILPALTQYLQTRGVGLVITDVAGRRDVLHSSISADYSILRLVGNDLHPSDFKRVEQWIRRFESWQVQGLQKVFLFLHEPADIHVPEIANFVLEQLQDIETLKIRPPQLQVQAPPQLDLNLT
jgi:uncharacterized protein YecE (DUF72 family)